MATAPAVDCDANACYEIASARPGRLVHVTFAGVSRISDSVLTCLHHQTSPKGFLHDHIIVCVLPFSLTFCLLQQTIVWFGRFQGGVKVAALLPRNLRSCMHLLPVFVSFLTRTLEEWQARELMARTDGAAGALDAIESLFISNYPEKMAFPNLKLKFRLVVQRAASRSSNSHFRFDIQMKRIIFRFQSARNQPIKDEQSGDPETSHQK